MSATPLNGPQATGRERRDMYDLVEWVAAQPWCDGNVGMIGISCFAMTQLKAAVERPPHLKAIFPVAITAGRNNICRMGAVRRRHPGRRRGHAGIPRVHAPVLPVAPPGRSSVGTSSLNTVRSSSRLLLPM